MKEVIVVVDGSPEGGDEALALDRAIFTDDDHLEHLMANMKCAAAAHLEAEQMPKMIRLHMVKGTVIAASEPRVTSRARTRSNRLARSDTR